MKFSVAELLNVPVVRMHNVRAIVKKNVRRIVTDSRELGKGDVFIALRGERFDGHEFIAAAIKSGALLAIVDIKWAASFSGSEKLPVIIVEDTTKTLGDLALTYRRKFSIPVIAVAGSNGKTTTKEMIATVLAAKYNVLSTKGNLNNHIGVPQTLFRLTARHEIAVVEVGTNHPGEIEYLCKILEPTHGILSNIGREHLEFFHDLDGVAKEEGMVFQYLRSKGVLFVNTDDSLVKAKARGAKNTVTYGLRGRTKVDVRGVGLGINANGCGNLAVTRDGKNEFKIRLAVPGVHALSNALSAATVGLHFKVPQQKITGALEKFRAVSKRMEVGNVAGVTILNDTYNANPDSVLSAMQTLHAIQTNGKKIVVLGDMREMGDSSEVEHRSIGVAAARMKFEYLLTHGPASRWIHDEASGVRYRVHYNEQDKLGTDLTKIVSPGDTVLIKGSRGMKMENVVNALERHLRTGATKPTVQQQRKTKGKAG